MRTVSGLTTVSGFEVGWNDGDERYMNHLDDIYNGRVVEIYLIGQVSIPYKEKEAR